MGTFIISPVKQLLKDNFKTVGEIWDGCILADIKILFLIVRHDNGGKVKHFLKEIFLCGKNTNFYVIWYDT